VATSGEIRYIEVPTNKSLALQGYLRRHGIRAAPPERCCTNVDTIELAKGVDTATIQKLLDSWA
jgi:hypothetical protein